jgi:flavin-dependent dehydrogenase
VQQACQTGVELRTGFLVRQPLLIGQQVCGVHGQQDTRPITLRARCIIAADGRLSTLARRLQLIKRMQWLQHIALVTHYQGVQPMRPCGEIFLLPTGYLGLAPVGDNLMNVSLVTHKQQFPAARYEKFFEETLQSHPELRQRFVHAKRTKDFLTVGPMAQRTLWPPYDGILFIGDAAGFLDPFTGQGLYLALHSAVLAAQTAHHALYHSDVSRHTLRQYYQAHQQVYRDKYRLSALIQLGLRRPWLANWVIQRLARTPALADTLVGVAGDFLSPHEVLSWRFALRLLCSAPPPKLSN